MSRDSRESQGDPPPEPAHDVLAAEAFAVGGADPVLRRAHQPAHDVLAADEFAVPAADPELHHGPVVLPADPAHDTPEAHDVLAADEFPMPAGRPAAGPAGRPAAGPAGGPGRRGSALPVVGGVVLGLLVLRRLARRRRQCQ